MNLLQPGKVFSLLIILVIACVGCALPPYTPITPTNAPPQLGNFYFPDMNREAFLNKNVYSFPGSSVYFIDPESNISQLIISFQQGTTYSSLTSQISTFPYTSGTLLLEKFVRSSGSPRLDAFSPGTIRVSIQAVDRAGARSNILTRTFVLL